MNPSTCATSNFWRQTLANESWWRPFVMVFAPNDDCNDKEIHRVCGRCKKRLMHVFDDPHIDHHDFSSFVWPIQSLFYAMSVIFCLPALYCVLAFPWMNRADRCIENSLVHVRHFNPALWVVCVSWCLCSMTLCPFTAQTKKVNYTRSVKPH